MAALLEDEEDINKVRFRKPRIFRDRTVLKHYFRIFERTGGWSGGAKVLGKLSVPGRPTCLDCSGGKGLLCLK